MFIIDDGDDRERGKYGLTGDLAGSVAGLECGEGEVGVSGSTMGAGAISSPNSSVSGRGGGRSTIASKS